MDEVPMLRTAEDEWRAALIVDDELEESDEEREMWESERFSTPTGTSLPSFAS